MSRVHIHEVIFCVNRNFSETLIFSGHGRAAASFLVLSAIEDVGGNAC